MTLIVSLMNRDYAVQVSDRRLSADGLPTDEESNKAVVVTCANARLIAGFTGVAQVGGAFRTKQWLLEALLESAAPDYTALGLTRRFAARATTDFHCLPPLSRLASLDKRLTVMFTGFTAHNDGPRMVTLLVTNYQDFDRGTDDRNAWPEFRSWYFSERRDAGPDATWVERVGLWNEFGEREAAPLRELLKSGRPPRAVIDKSIETVRAISTRASARGVVGRQMSAVILPSDFSVPPFSEYHSAVNAFTVQSPSLVVAARPGDAFAVMDMELRALSPGAPPLAVSKVSRNAPCPCKSGRKYKHCHGRFGPGAGGFTVTSRPQA